MKRRRTSRPRLTAGQRALLAEVKAANDALSPTVRAATIRRAHAVAEAQAAGIDRHRIAEALGGVGQTVITRLLHMVEAEQRKAVERLRALEGSEQA